MTKRITEPNNQVLRIMIAFGVLGVGFYGLTQVDFYYIQFSFLVISGLVSYLLVFGFVGVRQLFSTPKRLIKTFLLILVGSQIYGMLASMIMGILAQLLDIQTKANSAQDNPWWFLYLFYQLLYWEKNYFRSLFLILYVKNEDQY